MYDIQQCHFAILTSDNVAMRYRAMTVKVWHRATDWWASLVQLGWGLVSNSDHPYIRSSFSSKSSLLHQKANFADPSARLRWVQLLDLSIFVFHVWRRSEPLIWMPSFQQNILVELLEFNISIWTWAIWSILMIMCMQSGINHYNHETNTHLNLDTQHTFLAFSTRYRKLNQNVSDQGSSGCYPEQLG